MENLTESGHVLGMLDRDQRTAKVSVNSYRERQNHRSSFAPSSSIQCGCRCQNTSSASPSSSVLRNIPESSQHRTKSISHTEPVRGRTSPSSSFRIRKNDNRHFWVSKARLQRTLIIGFYLSIVTFPTTLAAPANREMESNGVEKWKRPCGHELNRTAAPSVNVDSNLKRIISQTNMSTRKANEFKEKFAKKIFKTKWDNLEEMYQSSPSYDWLSIPKTLGQSLDQDHLDSLQLEDNLYNSYEYLQRVAVGLDQIVMDEENRSGSLKNDFREMENYCLTVLCEIQTAIIDLNLPPKPDVERSILPDNLKNGDNTGMNTRNFLILREYINILEYVRDSFEYLSNK